MKSIKLGLLQTKVVADNNQNYSNIENMIRTTTQNDNVDIFLLPEHWYYMDAHSKDFLKNIQEKRGEYYQFCQSMSEKYNIRLISGAIWENEPEYKRPVINTYYFDSNGKEQFCQKKVHLYTFEKSMFDPGSELIIYRDPQLDVTFSALICFDVAFYEMPRLATVNGAEFLLSSTLIRDTGMENWDVYLKARALENRIPLAACNSVFELKDRKFLGKSKIIGFKEGPETPVLFDMKEAGSDNEVLIHSINLEFANKIRKTRLAESVDREGIKITKI
jgi:predicted amidohydrolase